MPVTRALPSVPPTPSTSTSTLSIGGNEGERELAYVVEVYAPDSEHELSLNLGDVVVVLEKDVLDEGWWLGRHVGTGKVGHFPKVFTSNLPPEAAAPMTAPLVSVSWPYDAEEASSSSTSSASSLSVPQVNRRVVSTPTPTMLPTSVITRPSWQPKRPAQRRPLGGMLMRSRSAQQQAIATPIRTPAHTSSLQSTVTSPSSPPTHPLPALPTPSSPKRQLLHSSPPPRTTTTTTTSTKPSHRALPSPGPTSPSFFARQNSASPLGRSLTLPNPNAAVSSVQVQNQTVPVLRGTTVPNPATDSTSFKPPPPPPALSQASSSSSRGSISHTILPSTPFAPIPDSSTSGLPRPTLTSSYLADGKKATTTGYHRRAASSTSSTSTILHSSGPTLPITSPKNQQHPSETVAPSRPSTSSDGSAPSRKSSLRRLPSTKPSSPQKRSHSSSPPPTRRKSVRFNAANPPPKTVAPMPTAIATHADVQRAIEALGSWQNESRISLSGKSWRSRKSSVGSLYSRASGEVWRNTDKEPPRNGWGVESEDDDQRSVFSWDGSVAMTDFESRAATPMPRRSPSPPPLPSPGLPSNPSPSDSRSSTPRQTTSTLPFNHSPPSPQSPTESDSASSLVASSFALFSLAPMSALSSTPHTWTLAQVLAWTRSKNLNLGPEIESLFIAHDITGDVLLALDERMLKEELGVMELGKRVRLVNAIGELRSDAWGADMASEMEVGSTRSASDRSGTEEAGGGSGSKFLESESLLVAEFGKGMNRSGLEVVNKTPSPLSYSSSLSQDPIAEEQEDEEKRDGSPNSADTPSPLPSILSSGSTGTGPLRFAKLARSPTSTTVKTQTRAGSNVAATNINNSSWTARFNSLPSFPISPRSMTFDAFSPSRIPLPSFASLRGTPAAVTPFVNKEKELEVAGVVSEKEAVLSAEEKKLQDGNKLLKPGRVKPTNRFQRLVLAFE